jgi:excisionase family DNA binding protein
MSTATLSPAVIEPVFLRVPEAMKVLSLSRTTIYELIRSKRLDSCTEGATRLIPVEAITAYKTLLMKEAVSAR